MNPLFVTIPHSGEKIPDACHWLKSLQVRPEFEAVLFRDVDRYVDQLYQPVLSGRQIPFVKTDWHRYVVDLNRSPEDIDAGSVEGCVTKAGTHARGYHWVMTTLKEVLMINPITVKLHQELTALIFRPFHDEIKKRYKDGFSISKNVYHLDLHSMPSLGTSEHRDPGERRADVVVSDCSGKSSEPWFVDLVMTSYARAGFKVGYNWPYLGGRVSETYGNPSKGQHCVQVELNRALYMNEETKAKSEIFSHTQEKLTRAIAHIQGELIRKNTPDGLSV